MYAPIESSVEIISAVDAFSDTLDFASDKVANILLPSNVSNYLRNRFQDTISVSAKFIDFLTKPAQSFLESYEYRPFIKKLPVSIPFIKDFQHRLLIGIGDYEVGLSNYSENDFFNDRISCTEEILTASLFAPIIGSQARLMNQRELFFEGMQSSDFLSLNANEGNKSVHLFIKENLPTIF